VVQTQACGWRVEGTDIGVGEGSALLGQGVHGHGAEWATAHGHSARTMDLAHSNRVDIIGVDVGDGKAARREGWKWIRGFDPAVLLKATANNAIMVTFVCRPIINHRHRIIANINVGLYYSKTCKDK